MPHLRDELPCPPLAIAIDLPPQSLAERSGAMDERVKTLPAKAGVLAIEDECGATLTLVSTANVRRAALVRLGPAPDDQQRSRRVDLRGMARRVRALTVGSAFEADWAYLQLARQRLPQSYRSAIDRWQAWFIHCDPGQRFPQWVKTAHPGVPPTGRKGTYVGPFPDKHAAARFIEMLEDAFDLCRYHHILVQAPNASACAYKEMGKCPAPCDGSIAMEQYSIMVQASIDFASEPAAHRARLEAGMRRHSTAMKFEEASRIKAWLERTAKADRHEFSRLADFDAFEYIAVAPGERRGWVRVFMIKGGWIAPVLDAPAASHPDLWEAQVAAERAPPPWFEMRDYPDFSQGALENISMVCRHLLLPRSGGKRRRAVFIHRSQFADMQIVAKIIASFAKPPANVAAGATEVEDDQPLVEEAELEQM